MNPIVLAGVVGAVAMWYLLSLVSFVVDADDILCFPLTILAYAIGSFALPFYWVWHLFKYVANPVTRERFEKCQFKYVWHITNNFKCVRENRLTWRFWTWFFFVRIEKGVDK